MTFEEYEGKIKMTLREVGIPAGPDKRIGSGRQERILRQARRRPGEGLSSITKGTL